jgi:hypothetical protein
MKMKRLDKVKMIQDIQQGKRPLKEKVFMILMQQEVDGKTIYTDGDGNYFEEDHVFANHYFVIRINRATAQ